LLLFLVLALILSLLMAATIFMIRLLELIQLRVLTTEVRRDAAPVAEARRVVLECSSRGRLFAEGWDSALDRLSAIGIDSSATRLPIEWKAADRENGFFSFPDLARQPGLVDGLFLLCGSLCRPRALGDLMGAGAPAPPMVLCRAPPRGMSSHRTARSKVTRRPLSSSRKTRAGSNRMILLSHADLARCERDRSRWWSGPLPAPLDG